MAYRTVLPPAALLARRGATKRLFPRATHTIGVLVVLLLHLAASPCLIETERQGYRIVNQLLFLSVRHRLPTKFAVGFNMQPLNVIISKQVCGSLRVWEQRFYKADLDFDGSRAT